MSRYKVTIQETLSREVDVNAESLEEAITKVRGRYYNEEIILDSHDLSELRVYGHRVTEKDGKIR